MNRRGFLGWLSALVPVLGSPSVAKSAPAVTKAMIDPGPTLIDPFIAQIRATYVFGLGRSATDEEIRAWCASKLSFPEIDRRIRASDEYRAKHRRDDEAEGAPA